MFHLSSIFENILLNPYLICKKLIAMAVKLYKNIRSVWTFGWIYLTLLIENQSFFIL